MQQLCILREGDRCPEEAEVSCASGTCLYVHCMYTLQAMLPKEQEVTYILLQATLEFMKAICCTESNGQSSQAARRLMEQAVGISTACIPCQHRSVSLAALSCMSSLLGRTVLGNIIPSPPSLFILVGVESLLLSILHACRNNVRYGAAN